MCPAQRCRPGCSVPAGSHCLAPWTPHPGVVHPQPPGTHKVAWWENPARVVSEAIRRAPEQVWTVDLGWVTSLWTRERGRRHTGAEMLSEHEDRAGPGCSCPHSSALPFLPYAPYNMLRIQHLSHCDSCPSSPGRGLTFIPRCK